MGISITEIRRLWNRLIFIMGIVIMVRRCFYIVTDPCLCWLPSADVVPNMWRSVCRHKEIYLLWPSYLTNSIILLCWVDQLKGNDHRGVAWTCLWKLTLWLLPNLRQIFHTSVIGFIAFSSMNKSDYFAYLNYRPSPQYIWMQWGLVAELGAKCWLEFSSAQLKFVRVIVRRSFVLRANIWTYG